MSKNALLVCVVLLFGCEKVENSPNPEFDWGELPSLTSNYAENYERCAHVVYDVPYYVEAKIDNELAIAGYRISGRSNNMYLGESCLIASVGTRVYLDPEMQDKNYYQLSVMVPVQDSRCSKQDAPKGCERSSVAYQTVYKKDIAAESIGSSFIGKHIDDIVIYEQSNQKVGFKLNHEIIEFVLPNL